MRSAAALLQSTRSGDAFSELLVATGVCGPSEPLDAATCVQLGIESNDARLASGLGSLRVLILETPARTPLRDALQRLTRRLATRAAAVLLRNTEHTRQ